MITQQSITNILKNLSMYKTQKPYLSEAQFQFELAWEIQKKFETAKVLLEYTACTENKNGKRRRFESDIIVMFENGTYIAIELKYKTSKDVVNDVQLIQQAGQPGTKYDYLWDIHRIELLHQKQEEDYTYLLKEKNCLGGYAIFLTNDGSYWSSKDGTAYNFRLEDKRYISPNEKLDWKVNEKKDWMKSRVGFSLLDSYTLKWERYFSYFEEGKKENEFRYLLTPVGCCKD